MEDLDLRSNIIEIQRKLTSLIGVSGHEDRVRELIYGSLTKFVDKAWIDPVGNVLGEINGTKPDASRVMLDAHMDEVGFMIRYVEPSGFLRFSPLGGIDKRLYPGSKVLLQAESGKHVSGIIGMPPPHITTPAEREKSPDHFGLFIDIGAADAKQVQQLGISIGTTGVLDTPFEYIPELDILRGRGFDDRTGCNVLLQIAKLLDEKPKIENTILFAFSTGEEVGARGTRPATFNLKPDIGIAVENTIAADVPGVPKDKCPTMLGHGPAFSVADHSCVFDKRITKRLIASAETLEIPWQYKLPTFGGTNAGAFHVLGKGTPAGCISVPCRYIHSPWGQLKIADIVKTIRVLEHMISQPISLQF
jgi:endoglucanase